jgi:hypothetical protein
VSGIGPGRSHTLSKAHFIVISVILLTGSCVELNALEMQLLRLISPQSKIAAQLPGISYLRVLTEALSDD